MMPNKRNPDPAELVRGRAARVTGHLVGMLALLKGLPAGYQRDLQEDKGPLFDGLAVLEASLMVSSALVSTLIVDEERMRAAATAGFTTATSVADRLVELGLPFREAHHVVGSLVAEAERSGSQLWEIGDATIAAALRASADEVARRLADDRSVPDLVREAATLEAALGRPDVVGGTAPRRVAAELHAAAVRLGLGEDGAR
jgi:argininosuccinate lyase